jgi:hypothetical protein
VSYRHSSYRKVVRAKLAALENPGQTARHHGNRISHWLNARPLDKPFSWGKRKGWRE